MTELPQLTPEQEREMEAYGDGVMAGINTVIRELKAHYDKSADLCEFGLAVEDLLRHYGVELEHQANTDK